MTTYRIGIIALGKIVQDQQLPVIAKSDHFELAAVSSRRGLKAGDALAFTDHSALMAETPGLDAVAVCTPPQARFAIAREALAAGLNVMLEKPPTATISELSDLEDFAAERGRVLMTTWHSQYNRGVDEAKRRLAGKRVTRLFVEWKEDVRKWHPGQAWIWKAGGFGVFDPGINALSIVTKIMPQRVFVKSADLSFPENAEVPIAASLAFTLAGREGDFSAEMDWRPIPEDIWEISVETEDGLELHLSKGGGRLKVNGETTIDEPPAEYEAIYAHFAELLEAGESYVDARPFQLVADAFFIGRRIIVEAFEA